MDVTGCDRLREVTAGCRAVLLSATETEAELLHVALLRAERHTFATKTIYTGEMELGNHGESGLGTVDSSAGGDSGAAAYRTVPVVLAITGCDKANVAHLLTCLLQAMDPPPLLVLQVGIAGAFPSPGPGPGAGVGDIVVATGEMYSDTGSSSPHGWISAADIGLPIARPNGRELGGIFPLDGDLTLAAHDVIERIEWPDSVKRPVPVAEIPGVETGAAAWEAHGSPEVSWPALAERRDRSPAVLLGPCVTSSMVTGLLSEALASALRWGALAESMEGAAAAHICALYGTPFLEIRGISNLIVDRDRENWQVRRAAAVAGWAALAVVAALERLPLKRGSANAGR